MTARATASACISFGMVAIPVKLYTAVSSTSAIRFKQLGPGGERLKQQYVDPDGNVVERSEMLKGYEFAKGKFVVFEPSEIKALEAQADQSVQIAEFVPMASIDAVHLDKAYYLAPERGGERPYALLAEAMRRAGLCGIARYAARGKQYLVALRAVEDGIVMQTIHYAHEVRSFAEVPLDGLPEPAEAELAMATQLIETLAHDTFDPSKYQDEVRERVEALIDQKIAGEEITMPEPAQTPAGQVVDLMAALKASMGQADEGAANEKSDRKTAKKTGRKAAKKASSKKGSKKAKTG